MSATAKPDDFLHRYLLRPGFVRKVRGRLDESRRRLTRDPLPDIVGLLPEPPSVVLDVGANIGYVAFDFHKAWPGARIWAFEPTPATFATLQANVGGLPGVECVPAAVSDHDGTATFRVSDLHGGGSNSLLRHSEEFRAIEDDDIAFAEIEVPTLRLDTFCAREAIDHVGLLKLDIEGAEPLALRGAADLLAASAVDVILSEFRLVPGHEGGPLLHDLTAQLAEFDYRPFGLYAFAESKAGQTLFGDAVFLGPGLRRRLLALRGAAACGFTS